MQAPEATVLPQRAHRLRWWKEALLIIVFYLIYSWTRNQFGSARIAADGIPEQAFTHAERIIRLERFIGSYHEETIQDAFLAHRWFIQFWNTWYGTAHFAVTIAVFIILFLKRPGVFPQLRNTILAMTALGIVGFAVFPLMPPRLLDAPCDEFGGACIASTLRPENPEGTFGYVDTLADFGGPWAFDSDTMVQLSNQYAAMPSLHIGWSTWCAIATWPLLRRRWQRVAVFAYPLATLFCIIVTANHYWIDGLGGLIVLAAGSLIGWRFHRWNQERLDRRWAMRADDALRHPAAHESAGTDSR